MPTICLNIQVTNLDKVLTQFDQIQVLRSTTFDVSGNPISFTELTTPATRIALVPDIAEYTFIDTSAPADTSTAWYSIQYYNSTTTATSTASAPSQGTPSPALDILSVEDLKTNFLFGIDLTDDAGTPYPDSLFEFYIKSAVDRAEMEFDIIIAPEVITGERHDFYLRDFQKFIFTVLDHRPVISVESVELVLPGNQVTVFDYDPVSFQVDQMGGTLELVPGNGQVTLGVTGWNSVAWGGQDYLPQAFRVNYTAGIDSSMVRGRKGVPPMLIEYIGMLACEGPLGIAGDLLGGAGIASQSISIDGLSQSFNTTSSATNSGYGSRILQYQKLRKDMKPILKKTFTNNTMVVA